MDESTATVDQCLVCSGPVSPRMNVASAETGELFDILVCPTCGLGQTSPQPDDLDIYYADYHGGRHGFTARFRSWSRVRTLKKCFGAVTGRLVLDVGCGDGDFLLAARKAGWSVVGTERGERLSEIKLLKVLPDLASVKAEFGESSFDAVTCWHTLEHFYDPSAVLLEIRKLLKSDGVVLIAVPDFGGWQSRFFRQHWLHLDVPRHLWHLTTNSLQGLLNKCGFRVKRSWHREFEYDVLGWSQSCLNALFDTPNVFFRMLSGHDTGVGRFFRTVNFLLGSLFSAAAVPLVFLGSLVATGGTLVVAAAKSDNNAPDSAKQSTT